MSSSAASNHDIKILPVGIAAFLLGRLGYRLVFTKQIHVQDCYSRVGREGGIRAVLPYHELFPTPERNLSLKAALKMIAANQKEKPREPDEQLSMAEGAMLVLDRL